MIDHHPFPTLKCCPAAIIIRAFAEMVERKIRQETGIKFIDILFLHSPQHISMTLNDLFERLVLSSVLDIFTMMIAKEKEIC